MPHPENRFLCALTLLLFASLVLGCERPKAPPAPPPVLRKFTASAVPGFFNHEIKITNQNAVRLEMIDVTLTVYTEAELTPIERHWGEWKVGEEKTIIVPARGGKLERIVLSGTATSAGKGPVTLESEWIWRTQPPADQ